MKRIIFFVLLLWLMGCGSVKRTESRSAERDTHLYSVVSDSVAENRVSDMFRELLHDYTVRRIEVVYDTAGHRDSITGKPRVLREIRTEVTGNVRERETYRDSTEVRRVISEHRDSTANVKEVLAIEKERKGTGGVWWWLIGGVAVLMCVYRIYKFLK